MNNTQKQQEKAGGKPELPEGEAEYQAAVHEWNYGKPQQGEHSPLPEQIVAYVMREIENRGYDLSDLGGKTCEEIAEGIASVNHAQAQSSPFEGIFDLPDEKLVEIAKEILYPKHSPLPTSKVTPEGLREDRLIAIGKQYKAHAQALADALREVEAFWNQPPSGPGMDTKRRADLAAIRSNISQALAAWKEAQS